MARKQTKVVPMRKDQRNGVEKAMDAVEQELAVWARTFESPHGDLVLANLRLIDQHVAEA